jgi:hypothetical protein
MYYLKKTDRHFTKPQAYQNHIRRVYKNYATPSLQAWIDNNELVDLPKCACGKVASFKGCFEGFGKTCGSPMCFQPRRKSTKYIDGYQEYILDNLDWYKSQNKNKNVFDPYTNKFTGNISYRQYIIANVVQKNLNSHPWVYTTKCKYCGSDIFQNHLCDKVEHCKNKSCVTFSKNVILSSIFDKYYKFIDRTNTTDSYINRIMKMISEQSETLTGAEMNRISIKLFGVANSYNKRFMENDYYSNDLKMFFFRGSITCQDFLFKYYYINKFGKESYVEYLRKNHFGHCFRLCKMCGVEILIFDNISEYRSKRLDKFCSHNCFHNFTATKECQIFYPKYWSKERKLKSSNLVKEKIKNGTFTPNVTNSWCRIMTEINIDGKIHSFRSSWEVIFFLLNRTLDYELIRIGYNHNGSHHNYIVDFVDLEKRILYEIKPDSLMDVDKNIVKREYANVWCSENNYQYVIVGDDYFQDALCKLSNIKTINTHDIDSYFLKRLLRGINK